MIIFSIFSEEETGRLVCIPTILVGTSLKMGVTSLMKRILQPCNWRLIVYEGGCATNDKDGLLPILISFLMNIEMAVTSPG